MFSAVHPTTDIAKIRRHVRFVAAPNRDSLLGKRRLDDDCEISDIPFYLSSDRMVLPKDGEAVDRAIKDKMPDVPPDVIVVDTPNRTIAGPYGAPSGEAPY